MHEKRFKIDFFPNFRKLQKKSFSRKNLLLVPLSGAVDFSCLAVNRLKSRVLVRFLWNQVSERFLMSIFWKKNLVNFDHFFDHISYQNPWGLPYGPYGGQLWPPPMGLVENMVEKMTKNHQFFFSKKKTLKCAQKPGFIKIVNIEPILGYVYDMTPWGTFSSFLGWFSRFLKESCRKN